MTENHAPCGPPLETTYFDHLILVKPETLMYRSLPVSPSHGSVAATLTQQVTLTWTPVTAEHEPSALAAWFVNLVRPEIGAENASALQRLIVAQWNDAFGAFFEQLADHRRSRDEAVS